MKIYLLWYNLFFVNLFQEQDGSMRFLASCLFYIEWITFIVDLVEFPPFENINCPGSDPSILRHRGIWGAADEAVLNNVHKKKKSKQIPL